MYDSQLETNCVYGEAVDGAIRCLPQHTNELYFADVGCTEPLHNDNPFFCGTEWSRERSTGRIHRSTGVPATLTDGRVWLRDSNGECRESFVQRQGDLFEAELVPSADFVEGTTDELTANGMTVRYLDGEDGSRLIDTVVHATYGYDCAFDENGRCTPDRFDSRPRSIRYTDANCTDQVYGFFGDTPPAVTAVRSDTTDVCAATYTFREVGAAVTQDLYTENSSGDCVQSSSSSRYNYFEPGPAVDVSSLPTATVENEGSGTLVARRYRDADGNPLAPPHEFYDTSTDTTCTAFGTDDGGAVCVPTNYGFINDAYFLDASCADPLALGYKSCDASTPATLILTDGSDCSLPSIFHVEAAFAPGAPTGPDVYFDNGFSGCRDEVLSDSFSAWETGASNLGTFPTFTPVVEQP